MFFDKDIVKKYIDEFYIILIFGGWKNNNTSHIYILIYRIDMFCLITNKKNYLKR